MSEQLSDNVHELAELHSDVAQFIGRDAEEFDGLASDFILRNLAVITDRLTPEQFSGLSDETRDQVLVVLRIAHDVAPLAGEDQQPMPDEDERAFVYRTSVYQPIHSLQGLVHTQGFDSSDSLQVSKIRFATHAAGLAFSSALAETTQYPVIRETTNYFWGNTRAAAVRAYRINAEQTQSRQTDQEE